MKLPNGDQAVIDRRKLTDYALNPAHDDGKHKARLFRELLGIRPDNVDLLIEALQVAAAEGNAQVGHPDRYGQRYLLDFDLTGPTGRALIRSVWIVLAGDVVPRLVTCYIL